MKNITATDIINLRAKPEPRKSIKSYAGIAAEEDFEKISSFLNNQNPGISAISNRTIHFENGLEYQIACSDECYFFETYFATLKKLFKKEGWKVPEVVNSNRYYELEKAIKELVPKFHCWVDECIFDAGYDTDIVFGLEGNKCYGIFFVDHEENNPYFYFDEDMDLTHSEELIVSHIVKQVLSGFKFNY